eukprot:3592893-Prymnesium_polylepis.1
MDRRLLGVLRPHCLPRHVLLLPTRGARLADNALHDVLVGDDGRVALHLQGLGVAVATAHGLVGRVLRLAATVARRTTDNAGKLVVLRLRTPESCERAEQRPYGGRARRNEGEGEGGGFEQAEWHIRAQRRRSRSRSRSRGARRGRAARRSGTACVRSCSAAVRRSMREWMVAMGSGGRVRGSMLGNQSGVPGKSGTEQACVTVSYTHLTLPTICSV